MAAVKLTTLDALRDAQIDGTRLVLPGWMDRSEYRAVDTVLRNLGGAWNRTEKAHVFEADPSEAIRQVLDTGQAPGSARTEEGFVATPPELAEWIVRHFTDIEDWPDCGGSVLEPSAGTGSLVEAIVEANPDIPVVAVEPSRQRAQHITRGGGAAIFNGRLEEFLHSSADLPRAFDAVVANPPFSVPGRPTIWIDHTWHAWSLLRPGGRLVSFAPHGLVFRDDRKHREVRALIERYGGGWHELDEGAFTASGTGVRAVVFWIDKPADHDPEADRTKKKRGKPTEEEKQERREEDREMRDAVTDALDDEEYAQDLADRVNRTPIDCRLRSYSPRNQGLVFAQADALGVRVTGHLNTFRGWAEQGRMVVKGSTALRIIAAMGDEEEKPDDQQPTGEEKEPKKRFRVTTRFDFSQTKDMDNE